MFAESTPVNFLQHYFKSNSTLWRSKTVQLMPYKLQDPKKEENRYLKCVLIVCEYDFLMQEKSGNQYSFGRFFS
jgi:hypothetical protein